MRRRWHLTAMVAVVGLIGLPVVPVPAGLLGIAPIQPSLPGEIDPIPRQPFSTAAPGSAGAATFGSPVIITGEDTGEPGIDIAQDGTIYVNAPAGFLSSLPGSASFVYRSTDGGATWVKTPAGLRGLFPGGGDSDLSLDPETGKIYTPISGWGARPSPSRRTRERVGSPTPSRARWCRTDSGYRPR